MEADWEFEVGGDAPVIDALWPGFIDLRTVPRRARSLSEVAELPALAEALERLNARSSPIWTSKCDFWPALDLEALDSDEMDAAIGEFVHAMGCYIDLLPKSDQQWLPARAAAECKYICLQLHAAPLRCCRIDLVIRRAQIAPETEDLGITAYLTACGTTAEAAKQVLEAALGAFADAFQANSTLQ
jgi:hypothetical protein